MNATQELHNLGQSLWLDNITRDLLDNGTLKRYIDEFSITGLTSIQPSLSTPSQRANRMTRRSALFCLRDFRAKNYSLNWHCRT
jgi:hypothetical protein